MSNPYLLVQASTRINAEAKCVELLVSEFPVYQRLPKWIDLGRSVIVSMINGGTITQELKEAEAYTLPLASLDAADPSQVVLRLPLPKHAAALMHLLLGAMDVLSKGEATKFSLYEDAGTENERRRMRRADEKMLRAVIDSLRETLQRQTTSRRKESLHV